MSTDARLKTNLSAGGRESRGSADAARGSADEVLMSAEGRRRMFREEFTQEALPKPPDIPGFHLCWLSTTNSYDPIHKRMRMGYQPVTADEVPGFEHMKVKSGEHTGLISVNEMVLYKLPLDVYNDYMAEMHHYQPLEEAGNLRVKAEAMVGNAKDRTGRPLIVQESDAPAEKSIKAPIFE